jgi:hypothetical protein
MQLGGSFASPQLHFEKLFPKERLQELANTEVIRFVASGLESSGIFERFPWREYGQSGING